MFVQWREGEGVSVNHASNELLQETTTITIMHAYEKGLAMDLEESGF